MAEKDGKQGMMMGTNKILLFRLLNKRNVEGTKLSFQTEHTFSLTRDAEGIITKDGTVTKIGDLEGEVSGIEAVQSKSDPIATMLQDSILNGEKLELWEVAVDDDLAEGTKYPAMYAQGYLTSWESGNSAEDEATYSGDFLIDLIPQFGMATLTDEQIDAIQYAFTDTEPVPET